MDLTGSFSGVFEFAPGALLVIILRTLIVYAVLFLGIRLSGKRELGQMTPFDLVVILIIANAVQNAMVGQDTSLTGGLVAALTLLLANRFLDQARLSWGWLDRQVVGSPTLLIDDGRLVPDHLRREGLQPEEVMMALREHGVSAVADVETAVLEVDGSISVVAKNEATKRTRHRFRGRQPLP